MNIPYSGKTHLPIIKRRIPGVAKTIPDAWGNTPNNQHYAAFDVPCDKTGQFIDLCTDLKLHCGYHGIARYGDNPSYTYVIARYVKD